MVIEASVVNGKLRLEFPYNSNGSFPRSKGTPQKPGKNHIVASTGGFKTATLKLPNGQEIPLQVSVNAITPPEFANANG